MPIYEYECRECGQRFEKMQSFQDEPIRVCPNCGGETRRVLHPVGVIFKGSGWYITDSRKSESASTPSSSTNKAASAEKPTESSAASAETTSTAAKDGGSAPKSSTASSGD